MLTVSPFHFPIPTPLHPPNVAGDNIRAKAKFERENHKCEKYHWLRALRGDRIMQRMSDVINSCNFSPETCFVNDLSNVNQRTLLVNDKKVKGESFICGKIRVLSSRCGFDALEVGIYVFVVLSSLIVFFLSYVESIGFSPFGPPY